MERLFGKIKTRGRQQPKNRKMQRKFGNIKTFLYQEMVDLPDNLFTPCKDHNHVIIILEVQDMQRIFDKIKT